jgi:hypothetical protein
MKIFNIQTYTNEQGVSIQSRIEVPPEELAVPQFFATRSIHFAHGGQQGQAQFCFDIPGADPAEAFANYAAAAAQAEADAKDKINREVMLQNSREANAQGIVLPPKGNPSTRFK